MKKVRMFLYVLIAVMMMPTYEGDHMSLQGGMTKWNDIRPFYLELAEMIDALPR